MSSSISMTVTFSADFANQQAASRPTSPPPMTTTFLASGMPNFSADTASQTLGSSAPGIGGTKGFAPQARMTWSKFFDMTSSAVASFISLTSTPFLSICRSRYLANATTSFLKSGAPAASSSPPSVSVFSHRLTL